MASVIKRTVDGRPRYDVKYRDPDGRQRKKTLRTRVEADRFATTVEADKLRGTYIDPDAGRITFRSYADDWLASQTFEATTREQVELRLRLHVYPVLGGKRLASIKPSTLQGWLSGLSGSPGTKRLIFAHVSTILSAAVDDERITKNPAKSAAVRPPRREHRTVTPWTVQQVAAMREALPDRYRIALDLAVGLGLRQGEVFGLSPDDVDFLRGVVEVRRQVKVLAGNRLVFGRPKGNKSRTIPLPGAVRDVLAAHLSTFPATTVTLPWRELDGPLETANLVLSTRERKPLNRNYFNSSIWRAAQSKAGINPSRENGMHALRHHYASALLAAGVPINVVSANLGHADAGFTLRTYVHLMPDSDERTRQAVDAVFGGYMDGPLTTPEVVTSGA